MIVGDFTLVNEEKVERALHGQPTADGGRKGGVEKEDGTYDEATLLAEYDKYLGLIKKGNDSLEHGCFWDFKLKRPKKEPAVVFKYRINGKVILVPDGSELPGIVKAARIMAEEEEVKPKKRKNAK